ncbi:thiamine phosphate synthase [Pedobacter punctiformis]|uniref:Thiamine-phosphate synthase n=1 Tax=Pedobacter punctiformis TaxID=3004097 RepID=A0ABT4L7R0_9SPHI|nr:thiamine phosphate synthase [Pedobacter sp. HCMS5-2]MCZ4243957.1 thiamine phosphate synthase [Pedobacter sp. HCMS5-2]
MDLGYHKLQFISQGDTPAIQLKNIISALDAGCKWIQLRFKNAGSRQVLDLATLVKPLCSRYGAILIINDHVEVAKMVHADGVHLGLQDLDVKLARNILGPDKIIGGTANTLSDVQQRIFEGCNYIGLGPLRFTPTKVKLSPVLGFKGYETIARELKKNSFNVPLYAIGGVTQEDVLRLMEIGIYGIAVSGMITQHPNKQQLIKEFNTILYENVNNSR